MHHYHGWHQTWHDWWFLIIWAWLVIPGYLSVGRDWVSEKLRERRAYRLKMAKATRKIERETIIREITRPKPEGCQHRKVTDVRSEGKLVGWLCMNPDCGKQFPADHDFEEE